jgi:hypothetical protein
MDDGAPIIAYIAILQRAIFLQTPLRHGPPCLFINPVTKKGGE